MMIKRVLLFAVLLCTAKSFAYGQELYVFNEPASNMPAKSIGVRITNEGMPSNDFMNRTLVEAMVGINKNIMFHVQGFASDMDGNYKVEGGSIYAKYRFLSIDDVKSHFRVAAFGRVSTSNRPTYTEDVNLEGDNAGWQGGVVFTQLLHKLALSATAGYSQVFKSDDKQILGAAAPKGMLNYSLSSGYLLLPFVYKNYNQPNFNLYFEMLGKTNPATGKSYLDLAPAVQLILNSRTRIDLGYRFQAYGNVANRYLKNMYLARVEFNFFNVIK
jgi:hypothetical protein